MDLLGTGLRCLTLPHGAARVGGSSVAGTTSVFEPVGEHGPGLPLLLLPALGLDGRSFARLAPLQADRRVVLWNPPNELPGSFDGLTSLVFEHASRAGLDRFAIGGSSLGGMIAAAAARADPGRVAGLIVLGACPSWSQLVWWLRMARHVHALLPRRGYHRRLARIMVPRADETGRALRAQMERRTKAYIASVLSALLAGGGFDLRPHLGRLGVPTLIVHGDRDHIARPDTAPTWLRIPRCELTWIAGAAHLPHVSHADACVRAMESFLARLDAGGAAA